MNAAGLTIMSVPIRKDAMSDPYKIGAVQDCTAVLGVFPTKGPTLGRGRANRMTKSPNLKRFSP